MANKKIFIDESNLAEAVEHIQNQFKAHSWWPTEQPRKAQHEFQLMKDSSTALSVWCEKWLKKDQINKLMNSIGK